MKLTHQVSWICNDGTVYGALANFSNASSLYQSLRILVKEGFLENVEIAEYRPLLRELGGTAGLEEHQLG